MDKSQIAIYLSSKVSAFSISNKHLNRLSEEFINFSFVNCASSDEFANAISESVAAITWVFKSDWYIKAPNLKAVFTPSAGREYIASPPTKNIAATFGTFHGQMMSESILGAMLNFNRKTSEMSLYQNKSIWERNAQNSTTTLSGQTVLIVGYGHIGKVLASLLQPFNCKVYGLQRTHSNKTDSHGVNLITADSFSKVLPLADHVISILPYDLSTDHFFKPEHFCAMKKSAYFYNFGRGSVCRDEEIAAACESGEIAGAALDVFNIEPLQTESPLWETKNILITPHSSCIFNCYLDLYLDELIPQLIKVLE